MPSGGTSWGERTRRLVAASVAPPAPAHSLDQQARPRAEILFGVMCQMTLPAAQAQQQGSVSLSRLNFIPGRRRGRVFCLGPHSAAIGDHFAGS